MSDAMEYLGDGVYAVWEDGMIKLSATSGRGLLSNSIYLDEFVLAKLLLFAGKHWHIEIAPGINPVAPDHVKITHRGGKP